MTLTRPLIRTDPVLLPHRTWRDLPASPPVADFLPPPDPAPRRRAAAGGEEPPTDEPAAVAGTGQPRAQADVAGCGLVAALFGAVGGIVWSQGSSSGSTSTTPVVPSKESGSPSAIVAALGPAVVQIEIGGGIGSGVIYDTSGLILTAHHVVAGGDEVTVRTADNRELTGRVVGRLPETRPRRRVRRPGREPRGRPDRRARQRRSRRDGHRPRQPLRLPGVGDRRHHLRPGPRAGDADRHPDRSDPDRRPDQPRQLGRPACRRRRAR